MKEYNNKGIDLLPDYSNCELKSELTNEMLEILYYCITHSDEEYTIKRCSGINLLIEIFEGGFEEFVERKLLYENWLNDMV